MQGINVIFKDKDVVSIDPVKDYEQGETHHIIDNGFYTYKYQNELVERIEYYDLCEKCKTDVNFCQCEQE